MLDYIFLSDFISIVRKSCSFFFRW